MHEQVNAGNILRQAPQQVYSNSTSESNMNIHNWPFVGSTLSKPTVRLTSFYQSIPSTYEIGNSSGYGQSSSLNCGTNSQNGFTWINTINSGQFADNTVQTLPTHGNTNSPYVYNIAQTLPNNGNTNGQHLYSTTQTLLNNGNNNGQYVNNVTQALPIIGNGNGFKNNFCKKW